LLKESERRACEALGFADHQRVSVVHHDTDHLHVHIAINRVYPRTAKVHSPSFSKLVLDRVCVELEADYGLQPVRHRERDRQAAHGAGAAVPCRRPPDMERVSGLESLVGFVQRECAESFREARSWPEVHDVAAVHGLRAQLRGNGLIFVAADGTAVKASSVSRDLSKAVLERRLGPFEGAGPVPAVVRGQYRKRPPQGAAAALYEQYLRERNTAASRRRGAVAQLREQRGQDEEQLRATSQLRWKAIRFVAKGRVAWMLWSAYARLADRRARDRALRRYRAGLRAAAMQRPRTGWLAWLRDRAARGDADALAALRARSTARPATAPNAVWGDPLGKNVLPKPESVTSTGSVIYLVPGGSIRDDGKRRHLTRSADSAAAAEALLRLAYARYGTRIGVDGDELFRARLERAVESVSLPITLVDQRLEQRQAELQSKEGPDAVMRRGRARSR
jgi:hypothetical protein